MKHGYFSPSQLELRFRCPGSVGLYEQLPEDSENAKTAASTLGTEKHELAARLRSGAAELEPGTPDDVVFCLQKIGELVDTLPLGATLVDEYQVDLKYLGIDPGSEGCRVDFLAVIPGSFAIVADYKFGAVKVDPPKYNFQMRGYCAGVARAFGVPEVQCVILQPNIDEESRSRSCVFTASELLDAETEIMKIVTDAQAPNAPLVRGEHCGDCFCRARPVCPLWRDAFLAIPQNTPVERFMQTLSPAKRREIYENLLAASKFCEKAIEAVKELAVLGSLEIDGYTVAEGRKTREWRDDAFVIEELTTFAASRGLEPSSVIVPISPAKAEKLFGKTIDRMVEFKYGSPILKKAK